MEFTAFFTNPSNMLPYAINGVEALAILVLGWVAAKVVSTVIAKLMLERVGELTSLFIKQLSFYSLLLIVFIAVLSKIGVQTASLVAIIGGMSIAIGLSLRSSLSNLASGILLIMFKPFAVHDQIIVDGSQGSVEKIELLFTYLKTEDNNQITIPNNILLTKPITKLKQA